MANAVVKAAAERGLRHEEMHAAVQYVVAHGIVSGVEGRRCLIGSYHFVFGDEGCRVSAGEQAKFDALPPEYSPLYLAVDGQLRAVLLVEDPLREDAPALLRRLRALGVKKICMLTGDNERAARAVAEKLALDDYQAEVLPEDKAAFVKREKEAGRRVIMVGDGVNDAPALSEADVGVAVSGGAAIAKEVADITITGDDLQSVVRLLELAISLTDRIDQNYKTIITFNMGLIALGVLGVLPPATSALLHNASTVMIGLHSLTPLLEEARD